MIKLNEERERIIVRSLIFRHVRVTSMMYDEGLPSPVRLKYAKEEEAIVQMLKEFSNEIVTIKTA